MTIKLRARVHRRFEVHPNGYDRGMLPWLARVYINDEPQWLRNEAAGSHAEAMQAAYKLLADLDSELMAEVHESRAARRAAMTPGPCTCWECRLTARLAGTA